MFRAQARAHVTPVRLQQALVLALPAAFLLGCESAPPREQAQLDLESVHAQAEQAYTDERWTEAERHYVVLVENVPREAEYWFRLANIYARTERPELAVRAYRDVLVRDAEHAKAWFNMGVVQLRQAANSFLNMKVHIADDDPQRQQADVAYDAILDIIGERVDQGDDTTE